jgi:hypothetical protein
VTGAYQSGRTLVVATPQASSIASVVLMRNTAQTHLVDGDARTVSLPVLARGRGRVVVGLPATTNVLPNGPYLLFANRSTTRDLSGRDARTLLPSRGLQLFVRGTSVPTVVRSTLAPAAKSHGKAHAKGHKKGHSRVQGSSAPAGPLADLAVLSSRPSLRAAARRRRRR